MARATVTKRSAERDGTQALQELETRHLDLPKGLQLEWIGVSGYRLTYEGQTIYIDPYVSRVPLSSLLLRRSARPDFTALEQFLPREGKVLGVLVGHTHFDHAVDAPAVAREFRCPAYGSASLAQLMRIHHLGELAVEVEPYRIYELGPFEVSFTPSAHSKLHLDARNWPRLLNPRPLRHPLSTKMWCGFGEAAAEQLEDFKLSAHGRHWITAPAAWSLAQWHADQGQLPTSPRQSPPPDDSRPEVSPKCLYAAHGRRLPAEAQSSGGGANLAAVGVKARATKSRIILLRIEYQPRPGEPRGKPGCSRRRAFGVA